MNCPQPRTRVSSTYITSSQCQTEVSPPFNPLWYKTPPPEGRFHKQRLPSWYYTLRSRVRIPSSNICYSYWRYKSLDCKIHSLDWKSDWKDKPALYVTIRYEKSNEEHQDRTEAKPGYDAEWDKEFIVWVHIIHKPKNPSLSLLSGPILRRIRQYDFASKNIYGCGLEIRLSGRSTWKWRISDHWKRFVCYDHIIWLFFFILFTLNA